MSVRSRLILLVLWVALPCALAMIYAVSATYRREERSVEQTLREATRALALAVGRELSIAEAVGRTLATSPALAEGDLAAFHSAARRATEPYGAWAVLLSEDAMLVNTRAPWGQALPAGIRPQGERAAWRLEDGPYISALFTGTIIPQPLVAVTVPATGPREEPYELSITITPDTIQKVLDDQQLPDGWVGAVVDQKGNIVARRPNGDKWAGKPATRDVQDQIRRSAEGFFSSTTLEGVGSTAFFKRVPQSEWTLVLGVTDTLLGSNVRRSLFEAAGAAAAMLGIALLGAFAAARRVTASATQLRSAATALQAGELVGYRPARVLELDTAGEALVQAAFRIREANHRLEDRVQSAVRQAGEAQQRVEASQRLEALSKLTGGIAHDVNNLLAVVHNSAVLLDLRPDDAARSDRIAAIQRAVAAGKALTQKLLSFAQQRTQDPRWLDLREWLPSILPLLQSSTQSGLVISLRIAPDVAPIHVDTAELQLALLNLAVNAHHAMPEGGRLELSAENGQAGMAGRVLIRVHDNGPGVPPDLRERIFEPFFTTRKAAGGTGLGLSQVYGFCAQSGGTVRLESASDDGSTFTLELPVAVGAPAVAPPPPAADAAHHTRLLYVEDNVDVGELTQIILEDMGYHVTWALSGDSALPLLEQQPFDIVLSDFVMPGSTNGFQLGLHLRKTQPSMPFVLLTGYAAEAGSAVANGFKVLQKPCSGDELVAALAQVRRTRVVVASDAQASAAARPVVPDTPPPPTVVNAPRPSALAEANANQAAPAPSDIFLS